MIKAEESAGYFGTFDMPVKTGAATGSKYNVV
jgi:hypothetical protein